MRLLAFKCMSKTLAENEARTRFFPEELCLFPNVQMQALSGIFHRDGEERRGLILGCPFLKEIRCGVVMPWEILTRRVLVDVPQTPNVD